MGIAASSQQPESIGGTIPAVAAAPTHGVARQRFAPVRWQRDPSGHHYLERCLICRRLRCRRRVLFFFHFQRNLARDFLYGFDL
jgi:hypothetical protein